MVKKLNLGMEVFKMNHNTGINAINKFEMNKLLKLRYENACNEYVDVFCKKQEMTNEGWVNDDVGEIICCSSYFFNLRDIRHDIDTNQPKGQIIDWYYECLDYPMESINYYSYSKGLRINK